MAMDEHTNAKVPRILVVCSANRCRSPMAEVLLQSALRKIGRADIQVESAGFMQAGVPAEAESVSAVSDFGLQLAAHRSRTLNQEIVDNASLILTMERAHVRDLAVRYKAFRKAFTIKEFQRRAIEAPPQREEDFDYWISRLHIGRTTADLMGTSTADEIADPIGKALPEFVKTRDELNGSLTEIAHLIP